MVLLIVNWFNVKKEKIVTFDLDGTLADTAPALLNAGNELLKSIGRNPIKLEQYKGFIGGGTKKQVRSSWYRLEVFQIAVWMSTLSFFKIDTTKILLRVFSL